MAATIRGRASGTFFKGYIDGGPELAAKLQALEKSVRDELLVKATTAGAEVIADEWRSQVAARVGRGPGTAHYEDAIGTRSRPGKKGATAWVGLPGDVPRERGEDHPRKYAPRLEFSGKPTLRPAFDASKGKALEVMTAEIERLIEDAV